MEYQFVNPTSTSAPRRPPPPSQETWEKIRPAFVRLYIGQNKSLQQTMLSLEKEVDFRASEKQFKRKIRAWGLSKNLKVSGGESNISKHSRDGAHGGADRNLLRREGVSPSLCACVPDDAMSVDERSVLDNVAVDEVVEIASENFPAYEELPSFDFGIGDDADLERDDDNTDFDSFINFINFDPLDEIDADAYTSRYPANSAQQAQEELEQRQGNTTLDEQSSAVRAGIGNLVDDTSAISKKARSTTPLRNLSQPGASTSSDHGWKPSFACHYYKADAVKYSACEKLVLRGIPEIKQHLYRRHTRPSFYCYRCYHAFQTELQRDAHLKDVKCSQRTDDPYEDRMTDIAKQQIGRRSQRVDAKQQWFHLWKILFLNKPCPPTPYVQESGYEESVAHFFNLFQTLGVHGAQSLYYVACRGSPPLPRSTEKVLSEAYMKFTTMGKNSLTLSDNTSERPNALGCSLPDANTVLTTQHFPQAMEEDEMPKIRPAMSVKEHVPPPLRCSNCRRSHKKCDWVAGLTSCRRCARMKKSCAGRAADPPWSSATSRATSEALSTSQSRPDIQLITDTPQVQSTTNTLEHDQYIDPWMTSREITQNYHERLLGLECMSATASRGYTNVVNGQ